MNGRLLAFAAIAVIAAVAATIALPAAAGTADHATYYATSTDGGLLVVDASGGMSFVVRGEQADGSYATVENGVIGATGEAQVCVPHRGPTSNGQPQYVVYLRAPDGTCSSILASAGTLEEQWWLD